MGYYNNEEVIAQEEIDQIVRWWKSHQGHTPDYLMSLVVADKEFFQKALSAFDFLEEDLEGVPAPVSARDHVALQQPLRRPRRAKRSLDLSMGHRDAAAFLMWLSISAFLNVCLAIGLAVTL